MSDHVNNNPPFEVGLKPISIEEINQVAEGLPVTLCRDNAWQERIKNGAAILMENWKEGKNIYGVSTGYGDSATRDVVPELIPLLPLNLVRFHGCGFGELFDSETTRAILIVRLVSLAKGASGVRYELLQMLINLINDNILPQIPQEGSVGASGDLTPLSYIAACLMGERNVLLGQNVIPASKALELKGLKPLKLIPKEALAIMNGTSVMAAIAARVFQRTLRLSLLASRITSMAVMGASGNANHFDDRIFEAKPHPGQRKVAAFISNDLKDYALHKAVRLQDRYSLRCAPHVIGVLADTLPWIRQMVETEVNSANDNPLLDVDREEFLHGGNFYGGHVAGAMDALKPIIANIAGLIDRQVALLVDIKTNHGLPSNLSGAVGNNLTISHGFKALQISISAMTAEAMKLTMPASVFSRSTECHNQDIVSMGTIAARDALRVLELTEQCLASGLIVVTQAIDLRLRDGKLIDKQIGNRVQNTVNMTRKVSPFLVEDRTLENELRELTSMIQRGAFQFNESLEP